MKLTTPKAARLAGATPRQLRYWAKIGLLRPSAKQTGHRLYEFPDIVAIRTIVALQRGGCSLQHVRKAVAQLLSRFAKDTADVLASLTLLTDGNQVYLVTDDQVMEVLSGQTVMHVVRLGPLIDDTRRRVRMLRFEWTERVRVRGRNYTLLLSHHPDDDAYTVQCRELPGAIEQGNTPEQAIEHGKAAIGSVMDFMKRRGRVRGAAARA
jgi:DNA-binding transcriptional MerR regulator